MCIRDRYDTYQLADFFSTGRKKLFYFAKNAEREYRPITIKKKSGGNRRLYAPSRQLWSYQNKIRRQILVNLPVSPYEMCIRDSRNRKRIGGIRESLGYIKETADCIDPVENK